MNDVKRLAQQATFDHKRNIGLGSSLRTGNHTDTIAAERTKQFAGDTRSMLHVLAHDSHSGQSTLSLHFIHGSRLNLFLELLVQHTACFLGIRIAHADAGAVLGTGLGNHEDRDALIGQAREDAPVDTDNANHRQTADGNQAGSADAGDSLDGLGVRFHTLLDNSPLGIGVEGILDADGDILHADGIDGGRIDHLGTEIAQLHCLYVTQFINYVSVGDNSWVGRHETIHIGPYLEHVGIQCCSDDAGRVVTSAPSQVGDFAAFRIGTDETRHKAHLRYLAPSLTHETIGQFACQQATSALHFGLDELATVIPFGTPYEGGHNTAADAFAIADDGRQRLRTEIADEIHTLVDTAQFLKQSFNHSPERIAVATGRNHRVYHHLMTLGHLPERFLVKGVAFHSPMGSAYQLVGNTPQGTHHHNHRLLL